MDRENLRGEGSLMCPEIIVVEIIGICICLERGVYVYKVHVYGFCLDWACGH